MELLEREENRQEKRGNSDEIPVGLELAIKETREAIKNAFEVQVKGKPAKIK